MNLNWTALPPLTTLRAFEATARLGGYSAAARALNVTPAAIAQQVRKLEGEIGAALVQRDGRGLKLTEQGALFAQPLHQAFAMIATGFAEARLRQENRGVRVSTTDSFASALLMPRIGDFWAQHPTVQVSFSPEGNTAEIDLDRFDIAVRGASRTHRWEGFEQKTLFETPMIICGSPKLIGQGPVDLAALPWVRERSIGGSVFVRMVRQTGCDPTKIKIFDPGSARLELESAMMGYGVMVTPEMTVRQQLADGSLVSVFQSPDIAGVYSAITRPGPMAKPVAQFLAWLEGFAVGL